MIYQIDEHTKATVNQSKKTINMFDYEFKLVKNKKISTALGSAVYDIFGQGWTDSLGMADWDENQQRWYASDGNITRDSKYLFDSVIMLLTEII